MDIPSKKRADHAWNESKDWITEFDGSPNIALLVEVPPDAFLTGLRSLAGESESLRITAIPAEQADAPQFIPLESLPGHLSLLQEGKLAELSANYAVRRKDFDLDIHLVIHALSNQKLALELVWWSDQVFSEETDDYAQFHSLMAYFIHLQNLFSSPQLFISPESGIDPSQGAESWVEV